MSTKNKSPAMVNHLAELLKLIRKLSPKYSTWNVFNDFLAMAAIAISNSVDWTHREKREAEYMDIVGRYEKNEAELFSQMLGCLIMEMESRIQTDGMYDVLGKVFHELELHNKYRGQFFTPQNICNMMGKIVLGANDATIEKRGYIKATEPCAGSGAMVLGFANAFRDAGYNHSKNMLVMAMDIDIKCVYMCYLQLSLYGIPAIVIHGNTLTLETYSQWYTPVYMLDGWPMREALRRLHALSNPVSKRQSEKGFYFEFVFEEEAPEISMSAAEQINLFEEVAF